MLKWVIVMKRKPTPIGKTILLLMLGLMVSISVTACGQDNSSQMKAQPQSPGASATPGNTGAETVVPAPTADYASSSLAKTYADSFLIGTVYNPSSLDGRDKELLLKDFNVITPENLMKPQYMQPEEGRFFFTEADAMMQFAKDNGLKVIGHTLAWHQQTGDWLGRNVTRDQAIEQLRSHITTLVSQYKGKVLAYDVVNEAVNDSVSLPSNGDWTRCLRGTQWLQSIGPDYLAMAFKFAHEADPDAKLYYNDYNLNIKQKAEIVHAMVKDLKAQGVPIHGIGMQGHYNSRMTVESVDASLQLFSQLGVEVSITELDVTVSGVDEAAGLTDDQEKDQAIVYAKLFKIFKKYKDTIVRVTFWGTLDNLSWRSKLFPLLFNKDYTPKEAYFAVLEPEKYLERHVAAPKMEGKRIKIPQGVPTVDGEVDDIWSNAIEADVSNQLTAWQGATGKVRMLWDESRLYVLFTVKDSELSRKSPNPQEQDSVEVFLDQNHDKTPVYGPDDGQYRVNYEGEASFGKVPDAPGFASAAKSTGEGYVVEMAIPLINKMIPGAMMGFDVQINDSNAEGVRQGIAKLFDTTDNTASSMEKVGTLIFVKEIQ